MADSAAERIKKLDEERASLLASAKKEALALVQTGLDGLRALGLSFNLVENGGKRRTPGKRARNGRGSIKDAPCPVCQFKTRPPHDARAHRGQKRKKPFNTQELKERGYSKA